MHIKTPLIRSSFFSRMADSDVWLKMESLQPVGSFKIRGVGHACSHYASRGAKGFVSSSGGNAGLAVAYAGRELGLPVTVVVPESTTARAIELIQREGAEVRVHGENWNDAHKLAMSLASDEQPLIHPYDDPLLWEGHAGLIDELAVQWQGPAPDGILVSVGGGGLLCGVIRGLERNDWTSTRVIAVETQGAASLNAACEAGELVTIDGIHSIATSLGARQVAAQAFAYVQQYRIQSVTVTDAAALDGCSALLDEHRILVEPACGAALAPILLQASELKPLRSILVIVCGGAGVNFSQFRHWKDQIQASDQTV